MIENFLLMTIVANFGLSSIPWWCYLIGFLFLFGFVKKRLNQTIHKHALNGKLKAIKKLANSKGIDCLEARDLEGCSPLHYAALSGHKEIVEFLLNNHHCRVRCDSFFLLKPYIRCTISTGVSSFMAA